VDSGKKFYELLTCPCTEVTNLIFPNDEVAWVSWKNSEDDIAVGKNINVAVGAYGTTQARLKLHKYLSKLGVSVLYCDTDTVIFIQKDKNRQTSKQGIIRAISQMSWRSTALATL